MWWPKEWLIVDPHAFDDLWPALGLWLLLFLIVGDGAALLQRQYALRAGAPCQATVVGKRRRHPRLLGRVVRDYVEFTCDGLPGVSREAVGGGASWARLAKGRRLPAHRLGSSAFLDDDFGYSRFKLGLFGAAFVALWLWALARYRFG